jgi:membrane-associated protease RseP (regulator of RpoE activity)
LESFGLDPAGAAPPEVPPPPRRRPRRPFPPWVNGVCFAATLLSTTIAGAVLARPDPLSSATLFQVLGSPSTWLAGLPYALAAIGILGAHEMGHYIACRYYRIDASLPFFLPGPNLFGTFGAVIRIRAPFTDRRALFDVGVAGPLAGFAALLPVLWYGLSHSIVTNAPPAAGDVALTPCLLLNLAYALFFHLEPGQSIQLHPLVNAAWLGLFATALNLLPIGQLDGGHMVYALSPRAHFWVSRILPFVLIVGGYEVGGFHLMFFGVLFGLLGARHPRPIDDLTPLGAGRRAIAVLGLVVFILSFIPQTPQVFGLVWH